MKRFVALVLACAVAGPAFHAGCSSRPIETGLSGRPGVGPTAVRESPGPAATGHRPVRPIPEVIAKAKPFRFPQTLEPAATRMPAPPTAAEQPRPAAPGPDIAGITSMMRSYLQAFNRHDPAALAAHWSPAGENVDLDSGETTAGREAVREVFAALFEQDAGATIDIDIGSIRQVRDDVAVVDGVSQISFTDALPSSSRFSAVLVRQAGGWVLDTVRESSAAPGPAASAGRRAPLRPLDELSWLVGSWEDTSEGVTASTQGFWSTNRAFLIRTHVVSADGVPEQRPAPGDSRIPGLLPAGPTGNREITEIIGWDADRDRIRSWFFTSAGRFAEGTWSREGNAWTVRIDAASGSDLATDPAAPPSEGDCFFTLTRMDRDDMACRCNTDRFADILPPACDYARTARAADESPAAELP